MTTSEMPTETPATERRESKITRRQVLVAGGAGLLTASGITGGFFIFNRGGKGVSQAPQPGGQGGQALGETIPIDGDKEASIDITNVNHFQSVLQSHPELKRKIVTFMGGDYHPIVGTPPDGGQHPWIQLTAPDKGHVTLSLQRAGLQHGPIRTWEEVQKRPGFNAAGWETFDPDTKISFTDTYPRLTIARASGWTNVGTPDERYFSIESEHLPRLGTMDPGQRRAEFMGLTGALFEAGALG